MKAAIDIGSNSIRLALSDGTVRSQITKLADGLETSGRLSQDGIARSLDALKEFAAAAAGCDKVTAFATEAVRKAADGEAFCAAVKAQTGLSVRVLTGEEEARLALIGTTKPAGAVNVCDLGGGSMELVSSADGITPDKTMSLPLGVVVLKNRYKGDYRRAIDEAPGLVAAYGDYPAYPLVISGGSACAIAAGIMGLSVYDKSKIDGASVTAAELDAAIPMLLSPELATLRLVCARRADTIPYGAIIIRALIGKLNVDRFHISDAGNLDAVLRSDIL